MIGVVIVRDGRLNLGAGVVNDLVDEVWLVGDGLARLESIPPATTRRVEIGPYAPATWARWLAAELSTRSVVLSAEPDGRDLAGQLAVCLGVPVYAGCLALTADSVVTPRYGGATTVIERPAAQFVATAQPRHGEERLTATTVPVELVTPTPVSDVSGATLLAPDMDSVDLADASRIVAGGAGLGDEAAFDTLARVAPRLSAAMGATRVVTDRGWVPFRRQIGTTGATVTPELYVAFGISGAVQHTAGLGSPRHVISVNLDPACPMSQMADLAVVADASATLAALETRLGAP